MICPLKLRDWESCREKSLKIVRLTAELWAWTSLGVEEQLLISSSCSSSSSCSPGRVKRLQKFINVCLKVDHSANLKHSKFTWRQLIVLWKLQNHNIKSSGHNARSAPLDRRMGTINLRQLSFWYRAFSCEPPNNKSVYTSWVTHLHITCPQ